MKKDIVWNSLGVALNTCLSFIFVLIVTRVNGLDYEGIFSYIFSLSLIAYTIANYGGRLYQISDWKNEYQSTSYYISRFIMSFLGLLLISSYFFICSIDNSYYPLLLILIAAKVFEALSDILYGIIQKNNQLYIVGISLSIKAILTSFCFLIIDLITHDMILSSLAYLLLNIIIYFLIDKKYSNFKFNYTKQIIIEVKQLFKKNIYIFLYSLLIILILNIPRYISLDLINETEQGYLGIILMIPTIISLFGQFAIQPIIIPITNYVKEKAWNKFYQSIKKIFIYIFLISMFGIFVALTFGPALLKIIFGINFSQYKLILVLVIIGGMFNVLTTCISTYLTIMRKTKIQFILYIITLLSVSLICYVTTKYYAFKGLFVSYSIGFLIQFILFSTVFLLYRKKVKKND